MIQRIEIKGGEKYVNFSTGESVYFYYVDSATTEWYWFTDLCEQRDMGRCAIADIETVARYYLEGNECTGF